MGIKVQKTVQHQDRAICKENVLRIYLVQEPAGALAKTRYLHGFQYYDNVLQFFHISTPLNAGTPEGYAKNSPADNGDPSFDYIYKYNGKELQDELGLNMYAMDMRMYDPAIA